MASSYYISSSPPNNGYAGYSDSIPVTTSFDPTQYPQSQAYFSQPQPQQQQHQQPHSYAAAPAQPSITPSMWQDAVVRSYGDGLKRRYDDGSGMGGGGSYKRMR